MIGKLNKMINKDWKTTDMWNFTKDHPNSTVRVSGGWIGENSGFVPTGYIVSYYNEFHHFGLDGHFIKMTYELR